jgi:hypothetical protein
VRVCLYLHTPTHTHKERYGNMATAGCSAWNVLEDMDWWDKVVSVSENGLSFAVYRDMDELVHIYEMASLGEVATHTSRITHLHGPDYFVTCSRTIIGLDTSSRLMEVSFENVILRTFPFEDILSFDVSETGDVMIMSFFSCGKPHKHSLAIAKLSTGEIIRTLPEPTALEIRAVVRVSPSGKVVGISKGHSSFEVYSAFTGEFLSEVFHDVAHYGRRFISDDTILVCSNLMVCSVYIGNGGNTDKPFSEMDWDGSRIHAVIREPYAYCIQGKVLRAFMYK